MRRSPAFAWALFAVVGSACAAPAEQTYVLCGNPACILVDRSGHAVMPRVFAQIEPLVGDLAVFGKNERYGVVHRGGRTVLPASYAWIDLAADGAIWATTANDATAGTLFDVEGRVVRTGVPRPARDEPGNAQPRPEVEILTTPQGKVLGDGQGRAVSEPFKVLYPPQPAEQSMFALRVRDGREESGQLFRDGVFMQSPPGTSIDHFHEGVAVLRAAPAAGEKNGRYGLIDRSGRAVLPAEFEAIRPARGGFVTLQRGGRWGVADITGRMRVEPTFSWIEFTGHGGRFAVAVPERRYGVVDASGRMIVPAVYDEITWVTDDLIAARTTVRDAAGRSEVSTDVFEADGTRWNGPPLRYAPQPAALGLLLGADEKHVNILMDRAGRVVARGVSGGSAYEMPDTPRGPFFVRRGLGLVLARPYAEADTSRTYSTVHQQFRDGRAVADDSLLGEDGAVLATYASAAPPELVWPEGIDAQAEVRLDPCFIADVTEPVFAEPLRTVCGDTELRALLRDIEVRHHADLFSADEVDAARARATTFRTRLLACRDRVCAEAALAQRSAELPALAAMPSPDYDAGLRGSRRNVPAALRRQILREAPPAVEGGEWSMMFVALRRDGGQQVLGWNDDAGDAPGTVNRPFALWARAAGGRWKVIAGDDAAAVGALRRPGRSGWRDLVVSQSQQPRFPRYMRLQFVAGRYREAVACSDMETGEGSVTKVVTICDDDAFTRPQPAAPDAPAR